MKTTKTEHRLLNYFNGRDSLVLDCLSKYHGENYNVESIKEEAKHLCQLEEDLNLENLVIEKATITTEIEEIEI